MDAPLSRSNSLGSLSFSLVGLVGVLALVMAGATIWLLLTDPVTVAESVDAGEVSPLVKSLAGVHLRSLARAVEVSLAKFRRKPRAAYTSRTTFPNCSPRSR